MTLFTRFLCLALLVAVALCVVVVATAGNPDTAFDGIGDFYNRVVH